MTLNILKNLNNSPATRKYPFVLRDYYAGSRGRLQIDLARCIFCDVCERICPARAIVKHGSKKDPDVTVLYDPFACIYCALCAEKCPSGAIYLHKDHPLPTTMSTNREITYGREDTPFSEEELP
jgi:formate hydrogenlyase subunit 6/NADH:ubiquinone oxidoreductase subunit I